MSVSTVSSEPHQQWPLSHRPVRTYLDYAWVATKIMKDKCWHLLWHFDLFERVDRIYPETSYYRQWWDVIYDPSYMGDNLYVGSAFNAADHKFLEANAITTIVNTTESMSNYFPQDFIYINYPAEDLSQGSLLSAYESFYQYALTHPDERILVHCYAGRSRSVSLVIYYLMRRYQWSLETVLEYVKQRRPNININVNFIKEVQGLLSDKAIVEKAPTESDRDETTWKVVQCPSGGYQIL